MKSEKIRQSEGKHPRPVGQNRILPQQTRHGGIRIFLIFQASLRHPDRRPGSCFTFSPGNRPHEKSSQAHFGSARPFSRRGFPSSGKVSALRRFRKTGFGFSLAGDSSPPQAGSSGIHPSKICGPACFSEKEQISPCLNVIQKASAIRPETPYPPEAVRKRRSMGNDTKRCPSKGSAISCSQE